MMKYLDEVIEVDLSISDVPNDMFANYVVYLYSPEELVYKVIYVGNTFLFKNQTVCTLYLNDIIQDYKDDYKWMESLNISNSATVSNINKYKVELSVNGHVFNSTVDVRMIYRYPTKKYNYNIPANKRDFLIQGKVPSHVPYVITDKFALAFKMYNPLAGAPLYIYIPDTDINLRYDPVENSSIYGVIPLTDLYEDQEVTELNNTVKHNTSIPTVTKKWAVRFLSTTLTNVEFRDVCHKGGLELTQEEIDNIIATQGYIYLFPENRQDLCYAMINDFNSQQDIYYPGNITKYQVVHVLDGDSGETISIIDICPRKYYLMWVDRAGGIQIQGFDGKSQYSETIDKEEIVQFKGYRKPSYYSVQPKWDITSGWIDEELYPIYESIYVSPYIILYDVENDESHRVILNDDTYTEKKYKNEKKMLNITLNLEASKKQNIIL